MKNHLLLYIVYLSFLLFNQRATAEDNPLGADYAFLFLMTMSPDFAATDYTIRSDNQIDTDISIFRLPFEFDIMHNKTSILKLEAELAFLSTSVDFPTFVDPGEYIASKWDTYGLGLGILYDYKMSSDFWLRPSLRYGVCGMENKARYHGIQTKMNRDQYDALNLFNWKTNAHIINMGVGLTYLYRMFGRNSNIRADIHHLYVDTFSEDKAAVEFSEQANMLALRTDLVFPSGLTLSGDSLDIIMLLGSNYFFGENRNTLGYTISYQGGIATWIPLKWDNKKLFSIYIDGLVLWAEKMDGWKFLLDFALD